MDTEKLMVGMTHSDRKEFLLLQTAMRYLPASIHIIELNDKLETKLHWSNGSYEKHTGIAVDKRKDIGFLHPRDIYHPDDVEAVLDLSRHLFMNPKAKTSFFCRYMITGKEQWVYVKLQRIPIESGKVHALSLFFLLQSEEEINRLKFDTYLKEIACLKNKIKLAVLSPSEKKVLRLLGQGLSTKEAANVLCRSFDTVNNHRRSIFKKLDIHKISDLVAFAGECGLD